MKKLVLLALSANLAALAQAPDLKTLNGSTKAMFNGVRNNVTRAAEKMPEEHFDFKPSPDVRSFGQIVGHVADAQYLFCSAALGEKNPAPGIEKGTTGKTALVEALKAAFAYCDKAYNGMTEASAVEAVRFFGAERPRVSVLDFNTSHNNEHYGNLVTYMRIKGLVPPSSEPRR